MKIKRGRRRRRRNQNNNTERNLGLKTHAIEKFKNIFLLFINSYDSQQDLLHGIPCYRYIYIISYNPQWDSLHGMPCYRNKEINYK